MGDNAVSWAKFNFVYCFWSLCLCRFVFYMLLSFFLGHCKIGCHSSAYIHCYPSGKVCRCLWFCCNYWYVLQVKVIIVYFIVISNRNVPLTPLDRRMWVVPLIQKKHKECTVQAPVRSILSCRLIEGFLVKSIGLITGSKGIIISVC